MTKKQKVVFAVVAGVIQKTMKYVKVMKAFKAAKQKKIII